MKKLLLILITVFLNFAFAYSQAGVIKDPDVKKQYEQVIAKANSLFDSGQYTASIHFYKKAQSIAPEKKLAKFRLEDIITIFIKNELAANRADAELLIEGIEARSLEIEKSMESEDTDSLAILLAKIDAKTVNQPAVDNRPEEWKRLEADVRKELNNDEVKPAFIEKDITEVKENVVIENKVEPVKEVKEKKVEPVAVVEVKKEEPIINKDTLAELKKDLPVIKPVVKKEVKPEKKAYTKLVEEKKQRDDELMQKYPDGKTTEVIKSDTKTTIRTIIHKDNKITVYLKVKHNWGGEYYFIDDSPIKIHSITKYLYETGINSVP